MNGWQPLVLDAPPADHNWIPQPCSKCGGDGYLDELGLIPCPGPS